MRHATHYPDRFRDFSEMRSHDKLSARWLRRISSGRRCSLFLETDKKKKRSKRLKIYFKKKNRKCTLYKGAVLRRLLHRCEEATTPFHTINRPRMRILRLFQCVLLGRWSFVPGRDCFPAAGVPNGRGSPLPGSQILCCRNAARRRNFWRNFRNPVFLCHRGT